MRPAILAQGLRKSYRQGFWLSKRPSLWGLDLEVHGGETFGFLGPNGAGKTTTIKLLMGLIAPTSGTVEIYGRPAREFEARRRVGFLPERPYFYPYLTARELVDFAGRVLGLDARTRRRRAKELLERVGIAEAADRRLSTLSKGMVQRAGLAQALVGDPDLLVLDEPMSGLDPIGRRDVRDILMEEKQRGKTIFFSSHILHDVELVADRIGILAKGRLAKVGALEDLVKETSPAYEVELRGGPDASAAPPPAEWAAATCQGESRFAQVEGADRLRPFLRWAIESGLHVERVTPRKATIEELFMREAGGGEP